MKKTDLKIFFNNTKISLNFKILLSFLGHNEFENYFDDYILKSPDQILKVIEKQLDHHKLWNKDILNKYLKYQNNSEKVKTVKNMFNENVMRQLKHKSVLKKVIDLLSYNSIQVLPLKGVILAETLYGNALQRMSKDIDILINAQDISLTDGILKKMGFSRTSPPDSISQKQQSRFIQTNTHFTYFHPKWKTILELHFRLTRFNMLYPIETESVLKNSKSVMWESLNLNTFTLEELVLYLAVHGTHHNWFRLFWLQDFHTLLNKKIDWENVLKLAEERHVGKILASSLLLSVILFETELPDKLHHWINRQQISSNLLSETVVLADKKFQDYDKWLQSTWVIYNLITNRNRKFQYLLLRLGSADDWQLGLTEKASFLYPFFKPWFVIKKIFSNMIS